MDNKTLKQLQNTEYDILCMIDDFCKSTGIHYSLFCGTLLGAVRHHGFIPWDDDVDIAMTRREYVKFTSAWEENPVPGYYLQNYKSDRHCVITHTKVRKDNTLLLTPEDNPRRGHHGIWIDIFPLDKLSNDKHIFKNTLYYGRKLNLLTRANESIPSDRIIKKITRTFLSLIPYSTRRSMLLNTEEKLVVLNETIKSNFTWKSMAAEWHINKWSFPEEMTNEYTELLFCDRNFPVFASYKELLEILYGEYMKLPPEEEQVCKHNPISFEIIEEHNHESINS